jgi:DinB superfamily
MKGDEMTPNRAAMTAVGYLGLTALAAAPKLTSPELDLARLYLEQTRDGVIGATKGLSPAQWTFKQAPDRWSIAEIVEHIVVVQETVLGPVRDQLAKAPPPPVRENRVVDGIVIHQFPDRTIKVKAPEAIQPAHRWSPEVAMERLVANYARLAEYLDTTPDLRDHAIDAIPLKIITNGDYEKMDGYQWILAAAAHTERHTKQILEVKADPDFPSQ